MMGIPRKRCLDLGKQPGQKVMPYVFIAPFLVSFLLFFLVPTVLSVYYSLTRYNGFSPPRFIGLQNYFAILRYPFFWMSVRNTLFYAIASVVPTTLIAFGLALLINSARVRHKSIFKAGIYIPQTIAPVASTLIFTLILGTNGGVINALLGTRIPFLERDDLIRWSIVMIVVWRCIGWSMLIDIAGLASLDGEVLEAARIDGASTRRVILRVIVPMMKPIFAYTTVIGTINCLKLYTEPKVLLYGAAAMPVQVQPVIAILVTYLSGGQLGMSAAVGWMVFLLILAIYSLLNRSMRFGRDEG